MSKPLIDADGAVVSNEAAKSEHHGDSTDWKEYARAQAEERARAWSERVDEDEREDRRHQIVDYRDSKHPSVMAERQPHEEPRPLTADDDQVAYRALAEVRELLGMDSMKSSTAEKILAERT